MQAAIAEQGLSGWLLYDFHGSNPVARGVLGFQALDPPPKTTRRWFYWVPAAGEPVKLVHRLEPHALDHLPGRTSVYLTWEELERDLNGLVGAAKRIAMEVSPRARLPYVSRVDGGTLELVRAAGVEVVTSADLAQRFEGTLDAEARVIHRTTGTLLHGIMGGAFDWAREGARRGTPRTEMEVQRWILERFDEAELHASDPPTVALNEHSADAHFSNTPALDRPIRAGDFLLIDAWAKRKGPGTVYADYTQVAFLGGPAPDAHRAAFDAVREARDKAIAYVREELRSGSGSGRADGATASSTGRGTRSARKFTETASISTISRRATSAASSKGRWSRWSPACTSSPSACGPK